MNKTVIRSPSESSKASESGFKGEIESGYRLNCLKAHLGFVLNFYKISLNFPNRDRNGSCETRFMNSECIPRLVKFAIYRSYTLGAKMYLGTHDHETSLKRGICCLENCLLSIITTPDAMSVASSAQYPADPG